MIEEMTSPKIKALLQKYATGKKYLEIGVFRGSTLRAAGEVASLAVGIDNFSQFDNGSNEQRVKDLIKDLDNTFLIVGDCFNETTINKTKDKSKFYNVFFYDGDHKEEPTSKGLIEYSKLLKKGAIVIVDDWNEASVRKGTELAQQEINLELIEEYYTPANAQKESYWNGIAIFKLL